MDLVEVRDQVRLLYCSSSPRSGEPSFLQSAQDRGNSHDLQRAQRVGLSTVRVLAVLAP